MLRTFALAVVVSWVVTLTLGCGAEDPATTSTTTPPALEGERPNLVLISLDTLRDDHMGSYGYELDTSPNLDAFAARGVLFEDAIANSPWTLPSHGSMLTGLYPRSHGLKSRHVRLRDDVPTLASVLRDVGYATAGLINSHNLSDRYGLERGFDRHHYYAERIGEQRVRVGPEQFAAAIEWLGRVPAGQPFFLFLHNYDIHSAYDPAPEYLAPFERPYSGSVLGTTPELQRVREGKASLDAADVERLIDLYDGGIYQTDAELAPLLDYLDHTGLSRNTIVVITSDHGEEFEEHGGVLHGRTMYEEVLGIPLLVSGPGIARGRRVKGLVQLTDLYPTLLSLLAIPLPAPVDGIDLSSVLQGDGEIDRLRVAFGEADHRNEHPDMLRMARVGDAKLIFDRVSRAVEFYDVDTDPGELDDLAEQRSQSVDMLMTALEDYLSMEQPGVSVPPLSREQEDNLRALGYIE